MTNRFVGEGLAGFVEKPFSPGRLISVVRQVLTAGAGQ